MLKPTDMLDTKNTVVKKIWCKDGRWTAVVFSRGVKYDVVFDEDGNFISTVA